MSFAIVGSPVAKRLMCLAAVRIGAGWGRSGALAVAPRRLPIHFPSFKQLIIYSMPSPKNAPTARHL